VEAAPYNSDRISRKKALFWVGLTSYAVSFALVAEAGRLPGRDLIPGWKAALASILGALAGNPLNDPWIFHDLKFVYVSLLISSFMNPLFLVILILAARGYRRTIAILRIILLLMIPFCWVVFDWEGSHPREGFFLWLFGMVLALFCGYLQSGEDWEECPWCSGRDYNCPHCAGTGWILVRDQPKLRQEIQAKRSSKDR
jgi:hypothetical protein